VLISTNRQKLDCIGHSYFWSTVNQSDERRCSSSNELELYLRALFIMIGRKLGLTEDDGHENDGPSKFPDMKLQDKNTVLTEMTFHYSELCKCLLLEYS